MIATLKHRFSWQLALALAAQVLFLAHVIGTAYVADDSINASLSGALANSGMSFWQATTSLVSAWLHVQGRFFPVGFYLGGAQFHLVHSVELYKSLLVLWTVLSSACVWWLMRELGMDRARAALVVLLTTVAFQFRPHDSIVSYAGLMQSVLAWAAISLVFFHRWLVRRKSWYLVGSLAFLVLGSLTYEATYLFLPLYALVAWRARPHAIATAKALIPVAAFSAAAVVETAILRAHATVGPGGPYQPKFIPKEIAFTFIDQFVAAVPLTLPFFDPFNTYHPRRHVLIGSIGSADILIGLAFAVATVLLLTAGGRATVKPGQLALFGLGWWALSAAPIALANRYQAELVAGGAHLPVYIECFGFGILVVASAQWLASVTGWRLSSLRLAGIPLAAVLAGVLVGSLAAVAHRSNEVIAAPLRAAKDGRQMVEDAGAADLFAPVPTDAKLYVDPADGANNAYLYRMVAGRRFDVKAGTPSVLETVTHSQPQCRDGWWTRDVHFGRGQGFVTLSCYGAGPARIFLWGIDPRQAEISWQVQIEAPAKRSEKPRVQDKRVLRRTGLASSVLRGLTLRGPNGFVDPYGITVQLKSP